MSGTADARAHQWRLADRLGEIEMANEAIALSCARPVAVLTLNRPDQLNADWRCTQLGHAAEPTLTTMSARSS